jgi:hypothetical protein
MAAGAVLEVCFRANYPLLLLRGNPVRDVSQSKWKIGDQA